MRNGKGKGKMMETIFKDKKMDDPELVGSLAKGTNLMAKYSNQAFKIAQIIEVSKSEFWRKKEKECLRKNENILELVLSEEEQRLKFKYYIHFVGENRRLDRWMQEKDFNLDPVLVEEEMAKAQEEITKDAD
jgi:hypothetical protein